MLALILFSLMHNQVSAQSCGVLAGLKVCRDFVYVSDSRPQHQLDVYLPLDKASFRPVLVIHGGCFHTGDKADMKDVAQLFAHAGFAAIVPNYTYSTEKPYPAAYNDIQEATSWLSTPQATKLGIESNWVAAYGESSGATLAAYLGTRPAQRSGAIQHRAAVDLTLDFYGRVNFTWPEPAGGEDCAAEFVGHTKDRDHDREAFQAASVTVTKTVTPAHFLIVHGTADGQVEIAHSRALHDQLVNAGLQDGRDVVLKEIPHAGHAFDGAPRDEALKLAIQTLQRESGAHPEQPTVLSLDVHPPFQSH